MASLSNSRWQNCKERPKRPIINNGVMAERAKRTVSEGVSMCHLSYYREAQLLKTNRTPRI